MFEIPIVNNSDSFGHPCFIYVLFYTSILKLRISLKAILEHYLHLVANKVGQFNLVCFHIRYIFKKHKWCLSHHAEIQLIANLVPQNVGLTMVIYKKINNWSHRKLWGKIGER